MCCTDIKIILFILNRLHQAVMHFWFICVCVYNSEGVSWSMDSHHSGSHWPDELSVIQQ